VGESAQKAVADVTAEEDDEEEEKEGEGPPLRLLAGRRAASTSSSPPPPAPLPIYHLHRGERKAGVGMEAVDDAYPIAGSALISTDSGTASVVLVSFS